jgi:hypothetical protein
LIKIFALCTKIPVVVAGDELETKLAGLVVTAGFEVEKLAGRVVTDGDEVVLKGPVVAGLVVIKMDPVVAKLAGLVVPIVVVKTDAGLDVVITAKEVPIDLEI